MFTEQENDRFDEFVVQQVCTIDSLNYEISNFKQLH